MDADFEQHYQAAERAYGLGEYAEAHALASSLWDQLQSASDEHDPSLVSGWRAVVSLLLGHIQLHGLQQREQATVSYQRVLECEPDATIAALAEQGLERCRSEHIASEAATTPASDGAIPDLLKDPFLSTEPDQARPVPADVVTAMPWLSNDDEPRATPAPTPEPTLSLEPDISTEPTAQPPIEELEPTPQGPPATNLLETSPTPAHSPSPEPTLTSEANSDVEMAKQALEPTIDEPTIEELDPISQEPAATGLLEKSWLRIQLQPEIKSPTDSTEPMGLINQIKGAIARSAGR